VVAVRGHALKASIFTAILTLLLVTHAPAAKPGDVTITGARSEENNKEFVWTVTNHSDQPIVRFHTHHYTGKENFPPPRWKMSKMTYHIGRGQPKRPGIIEFEASDPASAIQPGETATFGLRMDNVWLGVTGEKTAKVVFADGTELDVPGILCPARESFVAQNQALVSLGILFGAFLLYKLIRGWKRKNATPTATKSSNS
jgi:hypothetical protein